MRSGYDLAVPRHFLTGEELPGDGLAALLERALELKRSRAATLGRLQTPQATGPRPLEGRSVALIFERPSTRTRVSFEVGVSELGGHPVVLDGADLQLSRGESVRDTAAVMSRYVQAIGVRTGPHEAAVELATHSEVPVINMLTREHHPCQALADLLTLRERFGRLDGLKLAYLGDGNNVAHSLMVLGATAGMHVVVGSPGQLAPDRDVVALARERAEGRGAVDTTEDPADALEGAHAAYTDVWVSMGDEQEAGRRRELLAPYRLDEQAMAQTAEEAIALHCLPAHPGEEITVGVLYGERSAVWDQAENRLHAQKALLELLVE